MRTTGASTKVVVSGRAMARPFGISSPTTICTTVARTRAMRERDAPDGALADDRLEQRVDQGSPRPARPGGRGRSEVTRDAELRTREVERQVPQERARHPCPTAALLDDASTSNAVDGDERELGRDEEPVEQDEQYDGEQSERSADGEWSPVGRAGRPPTVRWPRRSYRWPQVSVSTRPTSDRAGARAPEGARSRPRGARRRAPRPTVPQRSPGPRPAAAGA